MLDTTSASRQPGFLLAGSLLQIAHLDMFRMFRVVLITTHFVRRTIVFFFASPARGLAPVRGLVGWVGGWLVGRIPSIPSI